MSDVARPRRVIVVAFGRNRVIGHDNWMPWNLPSDMKHFKSVTLGRPMIMGRKTFASIGKALPGRTTIVVTRDAGFQAQDVLVAGSIEEALGVADRVAQRDGVDEVMIAGGGQIYAQALPLTDRVIATEIALTPEGDVRFPELNPDQWHETSRNHILRGPRDDADYDVVVWDRRIG